MLNDMERLLQKYQITGLTPNLRLSLLLRRLALVTSFAVAVSNLALANPLPQDCGTLDNHYGPYDYTNSDHFHNKLPIVEKFHFSREQELSTFDPRSKTKVDFGYTLRTFPNHHRALMALTRYLKFHPDQDWKDFRPECYFLRALAFRPGDAVAHMIYAFYLQQNKKMAEAEQSYLTAIKLSPEYAEAHYNLGLLYTDQKRWPQAREHAERAYALNYPLPGLRKRLTDAGQWNKTSTQP